MIIEGAERLKLHQLREGSRGARIKHTVFLHQIQNSRSEQRLKALTEAKNGFELAELDLS